MDKKENQFYSINNNVFVVFLWILSSMFRFFMIQTPKDFIFEEKEMFLSIYEYFNRFFFFRKIQPTAGLLFTFFSCLTKTKVNLAEKEEDIIADFFIPIRVATAAVCSLIVPVSYLTLLFAGCSKLNSFTVSLFVLFENTFIISTRFVQPISFFFLFFSLTVCFWILFEKNEHKNSGNVFLFLTGLCGGFVSSTHLFGFLYYIPVIYLFLSMLWSDFKDKPAKYLYRKTGKCLFNLLMIPCFVYFGSFYIHFSILKYKGKKDYYSTRELQQSILGYSHIETYKNVCYGSTIVLRQERPENGYLHSHNMTYPKGSKQQQVSVYHHEDTNNLFLVRRACTPETYTESDTENETEFLKELRNGDVIRLEHVMTGRFLHSHHIEAHVSNKKYNKEVTCYGHHKSKFSDSNDNWKIEIVDRNGNQIKNMEGKQITAINAFVRLRHVNSGCSLHSRNIQMEEWAGFQVEVTCGRETLNKNSVWVIEKNKHPLFGGKEEKISYQKKNKIEKIIETHKKMFETGKEDKERRKHHRSPFSWFFYETNTVLWENRDINSISDISVQKIVLQKNKIVWIASALSVLFSIFFFFTTFVLRHMDIINTKKCGQAQTLIIWYLISYIQQLFLTRTQTQFDYVPIFYISILLFGILLNSILKKLSLKETFNIAISGVLVSASFVFFIRNATTVYGLWKTEIIFKQ